MCAPTVGQRLRRGSPSEPFQQCRSDRKVAVSRLRGETCSTGVPVTLIRVGTLSFCALLHIRGWRPKCETLTRSAIISQCVGATDCRAERSSAQPLWEEVQFRAGGNDGQQYWSGSGKRYKDYCGAPKGEVATVRVKDVNAFREPTLLWNQFHSLRCSSDSAWSQSSLS